MKVLPEKIKERLSELEVRVSDLKESNTWRSWLRFSAKLHNYSFTNSMLIHMFCPEATVVMPYGNRAGTTGWKSVGRQVLKGAKGIPIFAPRFKKDEAGDQELAGFHIVHVFDVSQTEGDPIPDQPDWPAPTVCPPGLLEKLRAECNHVANPEGPGLMVVSKSKDELGSARGYLNRKDKEIALLEAPEPQMVAVLLHELGHWFDPYLQANPSHYAHNRADCELVAESVMWLASEKAGIDSDDQVEHYLASWSRKQDDLFGREFESDLLDVSKRIQASFIHVDRMLTQALEAI